MIRQCIGEETEKIIKLFSAIKHSNTIFRKKSKTLTITTSLKKARESRVSETTAAAVIADLTQQIGKEDDSPAILVGEPSAKKPKTDTQDMTKAIEQIMSKMNTPQQFDIQNDFPTLNDFCIKIGLSEAEKKDLINIGVTKVPLLLGIDADDLEETSINELHKRAILRNLKKYIK
jgi:hypothetical protein